MKKLRRRWGAAGHRIASIVVVAALVLVVNYFGFKFHRQWDWTAGRVYTLSDQSRQVLTSLEQDVHLFSLLAPGGSLPPEVMDEIDTILESFEAINPRRVHVEKLDPVRDRLRAEALIEQYGLEGISHSIVVESGSRRRVVGATELVEFDSASSLTGRQPGVRALTTEAALTTSILAVIRNRRPILRFATGHGEHSTADASARGLSGLRVLLERQDLQLAEWSPLSEAEVPDDTDLLIIAGSSTPWRLPEAEAVRRFAADGGRVLLLGEPVPTPGDPERVLDLALAPLLEDWGLQLAPAVAWDPKFMLARGRAVAFSVRGIPGHPITRALGDEAMLFHIAQPVLLSETPPRGVYLYTLAESSSSSWGETNLGELTRRRAPVLDGADVPGPLAMIVAAERRETRGDEASGSRRISGRFLVIGDLNLASNEGLNLQSHRALMLNALGWLLEEDETLGIPPRDRTLSQIFITEEQFRIIVIMTVGLFPLTAIGCGLSVWWMRRRS